MVITSLKIPPVGRYDPNISSIKKNKPKCVISATNFHQKIPTADGANLSYQQLDHMERAQVICDRFTINQQKATLSPRK